MTARRAKPALRDEHERFFQQAPVAMASLLGPDHVYQMANAAHARLTGREDVVGHGIRELFPDLAAQGVIDVMDRVFATGEPFADREMPVRFARERAPVHLDLTLRAIPDGVMLVAVDVTERRLEAETLRQSNKRKDELLAMLAHELRNPLTPIRLSVELLRRRLAGAGCDRLLGTIERQTKQVMRIVDDLLEVSRLARRKVELHREPLDLGQVVIGAVEAVRPTIEASRHQLEISLPEEPVVARVDPVRIEQVLVNLLVNAAKYTEPPGHVWISLTRQDGGAEIRVRDDGIGLTPEMCARIFDLFEQGSRDVARTQGGLGIGLAIVRSLVELHDGSVEARSPGVGLGSEFIVRLPAHAPT